MKLFRSIWTLVIFLSGQSHLVSSFTVASSSQRTAYNGLSASPNADDEGGAAAGNNNNNTNKDNKKFHSSLESRANEIQVEKTRAQLEDAHTQSFLKRRPRKLPYKDARIWVQANLGCDTEEEFYDLVANGNLRTPYIPKQPEEYYTGTREWVSWAHFLHGCFDNRKPSEVKPATGVFD